jgi:hypothetical protein
MQATATTAAQAIQQSTKPPTPPTPKQAPSIFEYYDTIETLGDALRRISSRIDPMCRRNRINSDNNSKLTDIKLFIATCQLFDPEKRPNISCPACQAIFEMSKSLSVEGHTVQTTTDHPAQISKLNAILASCIVENIDDPTDLFTQLRDAIHKDSQAIQATIAAHTASIRAQGQRLFSFFSSVPNTGIDVLSEYRLRTQLELERHTAEKALHDAQAKADAVFARIRLAQEMVNSFRVVFGHTYAIKAINAQCQELRKHTCPVPDDAPDAKRAKT